jgi:hypothetical protein
MDSKKPNAWHNLFATKRMKAAVKCFFDGVDKAHHTRLRLPKAATKRPPREMREWGIE